MIQEISQAIPIESRVTQYRSRLESEEDGRMLQPIVASASTERVLVFLRSRGEGYAREMARFFDTSLRPIQRQLERLEAAGVLWSRLVGRTRLYAFNPRYPFLRELEALLDRALAFYPEADRRALLMNRRRPRRAGKPYEAD